MGREREECAAEKNSWQVKQSTMTYIIPLTFTMHNIYHAAVARADGTGKGACDYSAQEAGLVSRPTTHHEFFDANSPWRAVLRYFRW